ncbi:shikimate kinase [Neolewinella xylanilytica]|uniref:Shikimate kinase n=1 Tax=Neolewinella xylanilytica TaxID=1514080 RepID=A0A2S6I634_9BACT|nr:shikimate kinase [Neolewinella xylanilytica]PPK86633.1 shikimate kinase [Neolewinella xylanilytica]
MRVFLTGFMGSGKSFSGLRLAAKMGLPFIDLDDLLEQRAGMPITRLFANHGEAHFRQLEAQLLRGFDTLPMFVVATGGGTPCFHDNMEWMNQHGLTVFIDPTVDIIARRLSKERDKRPLLHGGDDLVSLIETKLQSRRSCYEKATYHVRQTNPKQDMVRLIDALLQQPDAF